MSPKKTDKILDPACGTAGFLISSYKQILRDNTNKKSGDKLKPEERNELINNFCGYDISPDMIRMSLVNLYLHGFSKPKIYEYDTLTSEDRWNEYYDVIFANPPFMSPKGGIKPHKKFSLQVNRSEVLFVDYICEHLKPTGKAGIIVPEGIIFQSGKAYKQLREMLVENYLWAVVSLPAGVFQPYSGVKTSILLIDKQLSKKSDSILFVKVENDGLDLGAQRRAIDKNDLPESKKILIGYKETLLQSNKTFEYDNSKVLLVEKTLIAAKDDYNLSIDRYRVDVNIKRSNYEMVRIGDICNLINGRPFKPEQWEKKGEGGLPIIRIQNLNTPSSEFNYYSGDVVDKFLVNKGDLLFSWSGSKGTSFGAHIWYGDKAILNQHIFRVEYNDKVIKHYLYYALNKSVEEVEDNLHGGVGLVHITKGNLESIKIPLPPLSVQQEIVNKIEGYQSIINGARQVVENYKPQIDMKPEWEMVELGEVCDIISGFSFDSKDFSRNNSINSIKITNVGVGKFVETDYDLLPRNYSTKYKKYLASKDDIVIALTRSIIDDGLKVSLVPDSYNGALVNQRVALIRCNFNKANYHYIFLILKSELSYNYIKEKARSLMQPNLSTKDLCTFQIPLPTLEEQQQIVTRIEQEQKLVNANKELIKLYEQKIKDEINKVWEG